MLWVLRMHRLTVLFACLMLSLGLGSIAHAAEGASRIDMSVGTSIDHSDGDGDQVPGDGDNAFPHHHGECHGHHIGIPIAAIAALPVTDRRVALLTWGAGFRSPAPSDADLRPPKA
ncbi:hypothetical protein BH09PSE3_BH09PSE3_05610 [soil metagenome]